MSSNAKIASPAPPASSTKSKPPKKRQSTPIDSGFIVSADVSDGTASKNETQPVRAKHKLFSDLRNIYSSYEASQVIGANLFAPNVGHEIRQAVLHSESVREAIDHAVSAKPNLTTAQVKAQVIKILTEMNAEPQEPVMRGMTYSVQKILKRLYRHVTVIDSQIDQLRAIAKKAADEKVPLILMPCHKSHIDYMVIGWLFFQKGISMPFVAAGENLDMPIVGSLLQGSGAFFIRRQFGTDPLYRVVFNEYITQVLMRGFNLEFFMEGGRSRTGKLLNPKMGLFSVVCDAFFSGKLKNAYIVPVWIGYDKVIETEGYIQEMLGRAKPPESLLQLLRAIELLKLNFGALEVRFGEAYSLKEAVSREETTRGLSIYSGPEEERLRDRRQLVNVLAYQTMYKINMVSSALPTSLVVTALLTHEGRGLSKPQLVRRVTWLRQEITKRGGTVCNLQGNPSSVVDQVAVLLGSAIGRHTHLLETVYTPLKRFELSYYRNSLIHFFVSESIIACCLYSFRINGARQLDRIAKSELMHAAQYLSRLLKHEFIYKPLPDFADTFEECLSWMISEGIVHSTTTAPPPTAASSSESSTLALHTQLGPSFTASKTQTAPTEGELYISLNEENYMFKFLCFLLWPFVECYWMVGAALQGLFPSHIVEEAELIKSIQKFGETLYYEGELNFYESISKETTKLALTRFYERKVIVRRVINDKGAAIVHLGEAYAKDEAKLLRFSNKIALYRRKGKYRTTAGTVDTKAIASLIPGSSRLNKAKL